MKTKYYFEINGYIELNALQRVFREAKFCLAPSDDDISASPIVAEMYNRLVEMLVAEAKSREGEGGEQKWTEWLHLDETREEWAVAVQRATLETGWKKWDYNKKSEYAKTLLSPFLLNPGKMSVFIDVVDAAKL